MKKKVYWQIILELWSEKEWISNEDFARKTKGSPKFTSRISDMRNKGVIIEDRWAGTHNEYKLITPTEEVVRIMSRRAAA